MIKGFFSSKKALLSLLFFTAAAVYINTLPNDLVYDDEFFITANRWITGPGHIGEIFSSSLWGFKLGVDSNYYRPLVHLVLMAEYLFFGTDPWGYHLVNVITHAANTALVFLIAVYLTEPKIEEGKPLFGGLLVPFAASLFFATHPVHVEAVAPASVIAELSLSFCYLLSFYLYARHDVEGGLRKAAYFIASIIFFAFGMFLKETAITLLSIILLHDLIIGKTLRHVRSMASHALKYLPFVLVIILYLFARRYGLGSVVPVKQVSYLTAYQYLINIIPLLGDYIRLLFLPTGLKAFYTFHPVESLGEIGWQAFLALFAALVFISLMVWKGGRAVIFSALWAAASLSPALYIPGVGARGSAFAERYLYIPSTGFAIILAAFLFVILKHLGEKLDKKRLERAFLTAAFALSAAYSMGTVLRNRVWENNYTLWKDTAEKTTDSSVVYINLGAAADAIGLRDEAIGAYNSALKLSPYSVELHNNLGVLYSETGRLDEAIDAYRRAKALSFNYGTLSVIHLNLGDLYMRKGLEKEAVAEYEKALDYDPENPDIRNKAKAAGRHKGG